MANNKAVKAGIGYTVGNYLLKGLSFFTIPVFSRILTVEDYGIVNNFGAYESILFVLIGVAIHSSFKNARYKYGLTEEGSTVGKDYNTYVSNAFLFILFSTCIWFVIAFLFRNALSNAFGFSPILILLLVLNSASNALIVAYNSHTSLSYAYKKFLKVSFFNAVGNIVMSLFLIYCCFPEQRFMGRIIGTVVPMIISASVISGSQIRKHKPQNTASMMKWGVKYSLPIVPHGISQIVLSSFDRIMITNMISNVATGLYSFAYNVFVIVQVTATSIDTVWGPWFYEKRHKNALKSIKKFSSIYMLFLAIFCVFIMLLAPEIIYILGGAKYESSIYCVIPVVAGGFFTMLYNIPASVEYYYEKTSYIAIATSVAAVINIVLNYIFINRFGYVAAAHTTFFTYLLYFLFHFFMARKIEGKSLFDGKVVLLASGINTIGAFISMMLLSNLLARWILAFAIILMFIGIEEKKLGIIKKSNLLKRGR